MEPVVCGLIACGEEEDASIGAKRVVFAKDQPQYTPLPAILFDDGKICTEWRLTEEERTLILNGENLRLWIWTYGHPLQPVALEVTNPENG